ncbi:unnamed protein product [Nesidiocoris tenuis]|uniref:Uncharacterized protein n=1 Tax=Nesidiocoris tenuis TaxID=355587 RepID=A0A6H5G3R1_9HEMI|nr:unnamed protein product [Nesidiocoris tenuis]
MRVRRSDTMKIDEYVNRTVDLVVKRIPNLQQLRRPNISRFRDQTFSCRIFSEVSHPFYLQKPAYLYNSYDVHLQLERRRHWHFFDIRRTRRPFLPMMIVNYSPGIFRFIKVPFATSRYPKGRKWELWDSSRN